MLPPEGWHKPAVLLRQGERGVLAALMGAASSEPSRAINNMCHSTKSRWIKMRRVMARLVYDVKMWMGTYDSRQVTLAIDGDREVALNPQ